MKLAAALIAATLVLAGCSGSDPEDASSPEVSRSFDRDDVKKQIEDQADQTKKAQDELRKEVQGTVVIVIKDGKATPQGDRVEVKVGDPVTLKITSDADEEIHVHSDPEHTYAVKPGDSVSKTFTIKTPGQVAVEAHHLGVTIVQLVVRP